MERAPARLARLAPGPPALVIAQVKLLLPAAASTLALTRPMLDKICRVRTCAALVGPTALRATRSLPRGLSRAALVGPAIALG